MMNKKILITGGAGFIGSAVIRNIINDTDHSVINLDKLTYAGNLDSLSLVEKEQKGVVVLMCYNQTNVDMEESIALMLEGKTKKATTDNVYRQVGTGAQILRELGVNKMRLMSAPYKFSAISGFDLEVVDLIENPEGNSEQSPA